MSRFFVEKEQIDKNKIMITGEDAKHIKTVLRCKLGEEIIICDGQGYDYNCSISEIDHVVIAEIKNVSESASEPDTKITLFQGLPKSDKMELIIQKCVELGVEKIIPVNTERVIVKLDKKEDKKLERWQKISLSASKQCGRGKIPQIGHILNFQEAIQEASKFDLAVIAYEKEENIGLKELIKNFNGQTVAVFIGPEGGFSEEEIIKAKTNGLKTITLGKRILRTETAGMSMLSILLYELE